MQPRSHAYVAWVQIHPLRDIFLDGLPILDCLEVAGSTAIAAGWINCDQSSVSRAFRRISAQLDLGFVKDEGIYRATTNQELLSHLRRAAQLRRLAQGPRALQWVGHPTLTLDTLLLRCRKPMPRCWCHEGRTLHLLGARVLDLAVIPAATPLPAEPGATVARLDCPAGEGLSLLMLPELAAHPCLRHLHQRLGGLAKVESPKPARVPTR
jgi:hypothetical protein